MLYVVTWHWKCERRCVFEVVGGFTRQGSGVDKGEACSGDVALEKARGVGSGSPGGAKRQGRGLGGGRTEEGAGQWACVASSGLLGPCKSGSRVLSLFYCKGATSGRVPGTQRRLGDPKISVLNSNEGHAQRRTWGIQREKAKDPKVTRHYIPTKSRDLATKTGNRE